MANYSGTGSNGTGLVFAYDMYNPKSWKGAPATNKLSQVNSYPDVGNAWGTYNTNQYNSNTYWTWGTVDNVTNNIVTFSTVNRTVYQYDVIRPATTGGGLTAGTNYIIRKINSTQFTIHAFNGSQDGSQGFDVHDSVNNDSRVSINATDFPTSWWGPPHQPNAGLVKEIIPNGFQHQGRTHSCIRLNYDHRDAGGGLDGWAYGGGSPGVTAGATYCMSWYRRAVDENAVGQDPGFSMHSGGGWSLSRLEGVPLSMEWERVVYRGTPPASASTNLYWWPSGAHSYEVSEIMFNAGSHPALYTSGSRSNTEALLDLSSRHTITATSLSYLDDGNFEFDGTNDYLTIPASTDWAFGSNGTIEQWVYPTNSDGNNRLWCTNNNSTSLDCYLNGSTYNLYFHGGGVYGGTLTQNAWNHVCVTYTSGTIQTYINGVAATMGGTTTGYNITNSSNNLLIGEYRNLGGYRFFGKIPSTKIYNRALSSAEVKQSFEATRGRFGI